LCTYVPVFLSTPILFLKGQIFTQNYHFWRFLVPYGHSFKATTLKFRTIVRSCGSLPQAKFCKKSPKGIYPFGANVYHKLAFLAIFWAVRPHLLNQNGKILREGANLGDLPPCQIFEKSRYPFGANSYRKLPISAILRVLSPAVGLCDFNVLSNIATWRTTIQDFPYVHGTTTTTNLFPVDKYNQ